MAMFLDLSPKASYIWTWLSHFWESMRQKPMPPAVMENSIWMPGPESWGQMIHVGTKIRFSEMTDISVLFLFLLARISQSRWKDYHKYTHMNILDKDVFCKIYFKRAWPGLVPDLKAPFSTELPLVNTVTMLKVREAILSFTKRQLCTGTCGLVNKMQNGFPVSLTPFSFQFPAENNLPITDKSPSIGESPNPPLGFHSLWLGEGIPAASSTSTLHADPHLAPISHHCITLPDDKDHSERPEPVEGPGGNRWAPRRTCVALRLSWGQEGGSARVRLKLSRTRPHSPIPFWWF